MNRLVTPLKRPNVRFIAGLIIVMFGLTVSAAYAADDPGVAVVVNSTGVDNDNNYGDGVCDTGNTVEGQPECTLRAAIQETNNSTTLDRIHFAIPQSDSGWNGATFEITMTRSLPGVGVDTEISGDSQPEFAGAPVIELHDDVGNSQNYAMRFSNAAGAGVEHLAFFGFGDGSNNGAIQVDNSSNVVIADNYIGVRAGDPTDATFGNDSFAIQVSNSTATALNNNVVGYNTRGGIDVNNASVGTTIDGNWVGVTAGDVPIPNGGVGIVIFTDVMNTTIGATSGNTVALNSNQQVWISGATGVELYNNAIGVTPGFLAPVGLTPTGLLILNATNVAVGDAARPNVIGYNNHGIAVRSSDNVSVDGNFVGIAPDGSDLGNAGDGVQFTNGSTGSIGATSGNVIGFNGRQGIAVMNSTTTVGIYNNTIGLTPDGLSAAGNGLFGIDVLVGADVVIGDDALPNLIGTNSSGGIAVTGASATITGNLIGTNTTDADLGNQGSGITLSSSSNAVIENNVVGFNVDGVAVGAGSLDVAIDGNFIGISPAGASLGNTGTGIGVSGGSNNASIGDTNGNVVSHNTVGVSVSDSQNALVVDNTIGLTPDRQSPAGNFDVGVVFSNADGTIGSVDRPNYIGDTSGGGIHVDSSIAEITGNYIGTNTSFDNLGNGASAIDLRDADSTTIQDNFIGFSAAITRADAIVISGTSSRTSIERNYIGVTPDNSNIGNFGDGIAIVQDTLSMSVANPLSIAGNTIGNNWSNGISIVSARDEVLVTNNFIGTNAIGTDLANGDAGIEILGTREPVTITGNTLANNTTDGIRFNGDGTDGPVRVSQNSIYNNGELAFDLGNDEVTGNDAGDGDSGPNGLLNYPTIDTITPSGPIDLVTVTIDAPPGLIYDVEFYENSVEDPSGHGEAETYLGTLGGVFVAGPTTIDWVTSSLTPGTSISAVLIEPGFGATSELSEAFTVNTAPTLSPIADQTNAEGDTITLTTVASDPDGDTLTYSASDLPDGLSINSTTGQITGAAAFTNASSGFPAVASVTVTATDDGTPNLSASRTFTWTILDVNRPPVLDPIADQTSVEGETITLTTGASDPDGDFLIYTATGLPDGLTIDLFSGAISGTLPSDAADSSPYAVAITVEDDDDPALTATQTFDWDITNTNQTPTLDPIADQTSVERDTITLTTVATDPDGDTLTYSASDLPDGLSINSTTGQITGTLTFNAAEMSPHSFVVRVSDGSSQREIATQWIVVPEEVTTTTVPPTTTTAPTTTVPPTTTTAPTTTVPPTTTSTTPSAPTALPFTSEPDTAPADQTAPAQAQRPSLRAIDDTFLLASSAAQTFDLLENDEGSGTGTIVAITKPQVGSVQLAGPNLVEVTIPESFAGTVNFSYELVDQNGTSSTAMVTIESSNVLSQVEELITGERTPLTSVDGFADRAQLLIAELIQIRLTTLQLTLLSLAPFFLAALHRWLQKTDRLVAVTGLASGETLSALDDKTDSTIRLRHDTVAWSTKKLSRKGQLTRVDLPDGRTARVPTERLADTGF